MDAPSAYKIGGQKSARRLLKEQVHEIKQKASIVELPQQRLFEMMNRKAKNTSPGSPTRMRCFSIRFYIILFSSPQMQSWSRITIRERPRSLSEYSTLGGI